MEKYKTIDQQLMEELLEENKVSSTKKVPPSEEPKKVESFTKFLPKRTVLASQSAILNGLDSGDDLATKAANWISENPMTTLLGVLAVGGLVYGLSNFRAWKPVSNQQEKERRDSIVSYKRKRLRERRKRFMEKARDLFTRENESGERTFDLKRTITSVSVATLGAVSGAIVADKAPVVPLLVAVGGLVLGYQTESPLIALGVVGIAVGALAMSWVRKTLKGSENKADTLTQEASTSLSGVPDEKQPPLDFVPQQIVDEINAEQEALKKERQQSKQRNSEIDQMLKDIEQEELPELA